MAKNKSNRNQIKKQQSLISEDERNNNPIFKAIYKRIRNLNKKLVNIDSLKDLDEGSLKPEQLSKIAGRADVENEIKKNEEFALFYKGVLDESGSSNDISQELIKIATLLAVGQNIEKLANLGDDANLHSTHKNSYQSIFVGENEKHLVDRIGDIFGVLTNFLKDPNQYKALQDYISYMPLVNVPEQKIQEVKQQEKKNLKKQEKKIEKVLEVENVEKETETVEKVLKQNSVSQASKVQKVHQEPKIHENVQDKKLKKEEPRAHENGGAKKSQKEEPRIHENGESKKPEKEEPRVHENGGAKKSQKEAQNTESKPQRRNFQEDKGKNYNQSNRQNNTNYRQNNNNNYRNRNNYYDEDSKFIDQPRKNKEYKGHNKVTRKDSGTSLQPTPQKNRSGKPRYIEKE